MKKFTRCVTIISVILLVVFIFNYVNECNQLRRTFGTFFVFNDSSNVKSCMFSHDLLKSDYSNINLFDNPLPIWIKVNEAYVYSAFWNNLSDKYAVALGVGPSISSSSYSCHVWFDLRNIIHSATGILNVISSRSTSNPNIWIHNFFCRVSEEEVSGKPYLFVLIHTNSERKIEKYMIPIFYQESESYSNKTALCVLPDRAGVGKASVVEFISFHQLIGLSDLLVYGGEANFGLIAKVKELVRLKGFLRSVVILPWNFPYADPALEVQLIEIDCSLRTQGITQAFGVLEWDQYIVNKQGIPILNILPPASPSSNFNYQFRSEICCIEQRNDKKAESSWPIVLQKTHCMDYPFYSLFRSVGRSGFSSSEVIHNMTSQVSVKTYRSCLSLTDVNTRYDHSPMKFLAGLLHSNLLMLWNSGKLY